MFFGKVYSGRYFIMEIDNNKEQIMSKIVFKGL